MKLHIFRMKNGESDIPAIWDTLDDKYPIYGFTKSKKIAKRFIKERDQSNFFYFCISKPASELEKWMHVQRGKMIQEYAVETYINKYSKYQDVRFCKIICTENEMDFLLESIDTYSIVHRFCNYIHKEIFAASFRETLQVLRYCDMEAFVSDRKIVETDNGIVEAPIEYSMVEYMGYNSTIDFDQLGCFILIHADELMEEFYKNLTYLRDDEV